MGKLGNWVSTQRNLYKLKVKEGQTNALTEERIKRLDKIGFVWNIHELSWNDKFTKLRESGYDGKNITRLSPDLATWLSTQRAEKRYKTLNLQNTLTNEREFKLDSLTFDWEAHLETKEERQKIWLINFEKLKKYQIENSSLRVPQSISNGFGIWVRDQRTYLKAFNEGKPSPMTLERRTLLYSIGFDDEIDI